MANNLLKFVVSVIYVNKTLDRLLVFYLKFSNERFSNERGIRIREVFG